MFAFENVWNNASKRASDVGLCSVSERVSFMAYSMCPEIHL